jgi:hypothetical protein
MSKVYLEPGDVLPEHAQAVLDFLNAAGSAREIADAVEIPGEPDIGVRLAQRILDARARLGRFTNLAQVRAIPLIGPERFTEIVMCLSGQPLPPSPRESELAELRGEIDELRRLLAELARPHTVSSNGAGGPESAAGRRLHLRIVEPNAFLGQAVTVIATVTERGRRVPDVPVTMVATRGMLRSSDGYETLEGQLISPRTTFDGTVRVTVSPATRERLSPVQEAALQAMLALLDAGSATPREAAAGLQTLAQQYAWEVNLPFRQAVDIFMREFHPHGLDSINNRDPLAAWPFQDSAVVAFAPVAGSGETASAVAATATIRIRVKDWLAAFLDVFLTWARKESDLDRALRDLAKEQQDAGRLVTAIYERAGNYVASRYGEVGTWIGRKVAETSIRSFLDRDLAELPLDTRVQVFPALDVASRTMATADAAVIRGLVSTRQDIERRIGSDKLDIGRLTGDLLQLTSSVDTFRRDYDTNILQIQTDLKDLKTLPVVTKADLDVALSQFAKQEDLQQLGANLVTQQQLAQVTRNLATNTQIQEISANIATVNTRIRELDRRIGP